MALAEEFQLVGQRYTSPGEYDSRQDSLWPRKSCHLVGLTKKHIVTLTSLSAVAAEAPGTVGTQMTDIRPSQRLQGGLPGGGGISAETRS